MRYCRKYSSVLSFSSGYYIGRTNKAYVVDAHLIGGPSNTQSVDEDTGILHVNDQPHELLIYWQRKWTHYSHCTSAPTASDGGILLFPYSFHITYTQHLNN